MGFLLKILFILLIVGGVGALVLLKGGQSLNKDSLATLPSQLQSMLNQQALNSIKNTDKATLFSNLSATLDNLVTHPNKNSPVVLGVKITNDSINTVVDVIQGLPPEQIDQIKSAICAPASSPTSAPSPTP